MNLTNLGWWKDTFSIKLLTKRGLEQLERNARKQALADLIDFIRKFPPSEKIILGPVIIKDSNIQEPLTLIGDGQSIVDCNFYVEGFALTIKDIVQK